MYQTNTPETVKAFLGDCHTAILHTICFRDNIVITFFFCIFMARKKKTRLQINFVQYMNSIDFFPQFLFERPSISESDYFVEAEWWVKRVCITCKEPWMFVLILHC